MGEFKKRMRELMQKSNQPNELVVIPDDFLEIVESAKKEFPCYPQCSWTPMDTTTKELGKTEFAPCEDCYQWREWFVKWFMDSADEAEGAEK